MNSEPYSKRGGARPNAGRPKTNRNHPINIMLCDEAFNKWKVMKNRTQKIEKFILESE